MNWREVDEGPSRDDLDRFGRDEDFDDGMFPDERRLPTTSTRLRWNNKRIAAIAVLLLILLAALYLSVF